MYKLRRATYSLSNLGLSDTAMECRALLTPCAHIETVSVRFCADILPLMASWSARDTPSGCTKQQRGAPISQQVTDTRPLQRGLPLA